MGGNAWMKKLNPDTATNGNSRYSFVNPEVTAKTAKIGRMAGNVAATSSNYKDYDDYSSKAEAAEKLANTLAIVTTVGTLGATGYSLYSMCKSTKNASTGGANVEADGTTPSGYDAQISAAQAETNVKKRNKQLNKILSGIYSNNSKVQQEKANIESINNQLKTQYEKHIALTKDENIKKTAAYIEANKNYEAKKGEYNRLDALNVETTTTDGVTTYSFDGKTYDDKPAADAAKQKAVEEAKKAMEVAEQARDKVLNDTKTQNQSEAQKLNAEIEKNDELIAEKDKLINEYAAKASEVTRYLNSAPEEQETT